ncbi:acylphosphatase [candidate division KSB1 bacterium]|nr:acylphosphatase [candidate division KSB1 bacterium]
MAKVRKHVHIKGRVQGVWFRASTREQASSNNVHGWVQNNPRGDVEAVFEGEESDVERVIKWCHQGPSAAHVTDVSVVDEKYSGEFSTFSVR